jgi:hypothetical protein
VLEIFGGLFGVFACEDWVCCQEIPIELDVRDSCYVEVESMGPVAEIDTLREVSDVIVRAGLDGS